MENLFWEYLAPNSFAYLSSETYEFIYAYLCYTAYATYILLGLYLPLPIFLNVCLFTFFIYQLRKDYIEAIISYLDDLYNNFRRNNISILYLPYIINKSDRLNAEDENFHNKEFIYDSSNIEYLTYLIVLSKEKRIRLLLIEYVISYLVGRYHIVSSYSNYKDIVITFITDIYKTATDKGINPINIVDDAKYILKKANDTFNMHYNNTRSPYFNYGKVDLFQLYNTFHTQLKENKLTKSTPPNNTLKTVYDKFIKYYKQRIFYKNNTKQVILRVQADFLEHIYSLDEMHAVETKPLHSILLEISN